MGAALAALGGLGGIFGNHLQMLGSLQAFQNPQNLQQLQQLAMLQQASGNPQAFFLQNQVCYKRFVARTPQKKNIPYNNKILSTLRVITNNTYLFIIIINSVVIKQIIAKFY